MYNVGFYKTGDIVVGDITHTSTTDDAKQLSIDNRSSAIDSSLGHLEEVNEEAYSKSVFL
jgi:hypothetical protein